MFVLRTSRTGYQLGVGKFTTHGNYIHNPIEYSSGIIHHECLLFFGRCARMQLLSTFTRSWLTSKRTLFERVHAPCTVPVKATLRRTSAKDLHLRALVKHPKSGCNFGLLLLELKAMVVESNRSEFEKLTLFNLQVRHEQSCNTKA